MAATLLQLVKGKYFGSRLGQLRVASAVAIATGVTDTYDVDVDEFDNISVLVSMSGAASGDLSVTVEPFATDGTVLPIPLVPAVTASGPTFASPNVYYAAQFDVRGLLQVRITVKNNNAAGETINYVDVIAGITGCDAL